MRGESGYPFTDLPIQCLDGVFHVFRYPYPPETYENVFAQLSAIVDGEAPGLPDDDQVAFEEGLDGFDISEKRVRRRWSPEARHWVSRCLVKNAEERASYSELLVSALNLMAVDRSLIYAQAHPWMKMDTEREVDMASWVAHAIEWRDQGRRNNHNVRYA